MTAVIHLSDPDIGLSYCGEPVTIIEAEGDTRPVCQTCHRGAMKTVRRQADATYREALRVQTERAREAARIERDHLLDLRTLVQASVAAERDEYREVIERVRRLADSHSFGVSVPGAREADPSHNGAHEVVRRDALLDLLPDTPTTDRSTT